MADSPVELDDAVVEMAMDMIGSRQHRSYIRASIAHVLDCYDDHILQLYINEATKRVGDDAKRDPEEHRAESIAMLRELIRDPNIKVSERLRANEQLANLLGLMGEAAGQTPQEMAASIRDALAAMDGVIGEEEHDEAAGDAAGSEVKDATPKD